MNITVCIKQVPASNEVQMDPVTNTIIRDANDAIINPFDTFAIEEAIRLKERYCGHITALSMGIPAVAELLREAISLGCDDAILLSDKAFSGADTLATAYALSLAVPKDSELIICGKQATDGDTAQVGPMLAEALSIPHVTDVSKVINISDGHIVCQRMTDDGYETVSAELPALITVTKEINVPRLPSISGLLRSINAQVEVLAAADVAADTTRTGLSGSPTQVVRTFVPTHLVENIYISGNSPIEKAVALISSCKEYDLTGGIL